MIHLYIRCWHMGLSASLRVNNYIHIHNKNILFQYTLVKFAHTVKTDHFNFDNIVLSFCAPKKNIHVTNDTVWQMNKIMNIQLLEAVFFTKHPVGLYQDTFILSHRQAWSIRKSNRLSQLWTTVTVNSKSPWGEAEVSNSQRTITTSEFLSALLFFRWWLFVPFASFSDAGCASARPV